MRQRPSTLLQNSNKVVDANVGASFIQELGELFVKFVCCEDVSEHSVEFGGKLISASLLQSKNERSVSGTEDRYTVKHSTVAPRAYKDKKLVSLQISTYPSYIWSTDSKTVLR